MATQMDIAGIVAAAVTVLTIGAAIASSARKDRFEERRLERMDEERASLNRINMMRQNLLMNQNQPQVVYVNSPPQRDVNWVENNQVPRYYEDPIYRNTFYGSKEVTFDHNDQTIRAIASRPPSPSPIFGIGYRR